MVPVSSSKRAENVTSERQLIEFAITFDGKTHSARYAVSPTGQPGNVYVTVFAASGEDTAATTAADHLEVAKVVFLRMLVVAKSLRSS